MRTRKQDPDQNAFRQDAYSSSTEYERGILGNLVAARCQLYTEPEDVALLWWLQQISWRDGGLVKFASDFLHRYRHLIGTSSMHVFGREPGRIYTTDECLAIRGEIHINGRRGQDHFPLHGHPTTTETINLQFARATDGDSYDQRCEIERRRSEEYPSTYSVEDFLEYCEIQPTDFANELRRFMVDPKTELRSGLWNIPDLREGLRHCRNQEVGSAAGEIVETEVTRQVFAELDFAFEQRAFIVVEGREGIGKSEAAQNWCARHPGQAVFVKMESGTDEVTFFRSIARKIGTACSYARKAVEMKARIQDALQPGHLMLVVDESHFLWPQTDRSQRAAPKRVDWLRTALIDMGVAVALISTPQFFESQCNRFRKGGWNANQIQRRLARTLMLPEELETKDIVSVARRSFPKQDLGTLKKIAAVALGSVAYLTAIKHIRMRTDFLAAREQCDETKLIERVLSEKGLRLTPIEPASAPRGVVKAGLTAPARTHEVTVPPPRRASASIPFQLTEAPIQ